MVHLDGLDLGRQAGGANMTTSPGFITPVSTRPTGTVPMPPILYTSCRGRRSGLSSGRSGGSRLSSASSSVGPLYQGMLSDFSIMLSPWPQPEMGTNRHLLGACSPTFLMYGRHLLLDLVEALLAHLTHLSVHLVDGDDHLLDAKRKGEQRVLAGLAVLGDAGLELAEPDARRPRSRRSACDVPVIMFLSQPASVIAASLAPKSTLSSSLTFFPMKRRTPSPLPTTS